MRGGDAGDLNMEIVPMENPGPFESMNLDGELESNKELDIGENRMKSRACSVETSF